jgi:hypothetical protein
MVRTVLWRRRPAGGFILVKFQKTPARHQRHARHPLKTLVLLSTVPLRHEQQRNYNEREHAESIITICRANSELEP